MDRITDIFKKRHWRDDKSHTFEKTYVTVHLASSRKQFNRQDLRGFFALVERLSNPERYGLIKLGAVEDPVQNGASGVSWSVNFSLTVRRDVGVRQITVVSDISRHGATTDNTKWSFPHKHGPATVSASEQEPVTEPMTSSEEPQNQASDLLESDCAQTPKLNSTSADSSAEDPNPIAALVDAMVAMPKGNESDVPPNTVADVPLNKSEEGEKSEDDAVGSGISIFDCWRRIWLRKVSGSFLKDGAAILRIQGSRDLQRASKLTVVVEYADDKQQTFIIDDPTEGYRRELTYGEIVTGVVSSFSDYPAEGFTVKLVGYGIEGFVHISNISDEFVHDAADYVSIGECVAIKYIGFDFGRHQFVMRGVSQSG